MKLLIAEDDVLFQKMLAQVLAPQYDITLACNGDEAWEILQRPGAPRLAILDWVMPGLSGPEICRKVRACPSLASMYLIIVTSKNNEADIVSGLRAGADDYITKPPIAAELKARVRVGDRVLTLQEAVETQSITRNVHAERETSSIRPARNGSAGKSPAAIQRHSIDLYEPFDNGRVSYVDGGVGVNALSIHSMENFHSKG